MRRCAALVALAVAALSGPASAAPPIPDTSSLTDCVRQLVLVAEPVPRTLEERIAAAVRDVNSVVRFAGCVAEG